ncbi:unnamed protein product [Paramecium sonneborni]|nr:unnamed protein product [Paramecium sonneborni]
MNNINQQIQQLNNERQDKLLKLDERLNRLKENVSKMRAELNLPQENNDKF